MAVTLFDNKGYAAIIVVKSPSREFAVSLSPIETAVQKLVDDGQTGNQRSHCQFLVCRLHNNNL
jgi:hypothetical protein